MVKIIELIYSDKYEVDLGSHPFITKKYRLVKDLLKQTYQNKINFLEPKKCSKEDLLFVHTKEYVDKVINLNLTYEEILKLEIPVNKEIVDAAMISVSGTLLASKIAIKEKIGIHLGGGWHHAFDDHGEGFCIFNDIAIAAKKLLKETKFERIAIIDCDLHQGNGTAKIFQNNPNIFTFSIHQQDIYPYPKQKSSLDIELPAYTKDTEYLSKLENGLRIVENWGPQFIFYQAGVDCFENDQLGNLKISKHGITKRDEMIRDFFRNVPLVVTFGGGYAYNSQDTVELHYNTVKVFIESLID